MLWLGIALIFVALPLWLRGCKWLDEQESDFTERLRYPAKWEDEA